MGRKQAAYKAINLMSLISKKVLLGGIECYVHERGLRGKEGCSYNALEMDE